MTRYNNYHRHSHKSNVISLDVVVKNEDYCKRAVELGHDKIFTTEHGFQGDLFETLTLAEQYNLQMVVGAECYYVKDRKAVDEEGRKDRSNMHIILVALNNDGVRDLQRIVSEANIDGYYYKPRIDHELLFSINPKNMIITTACVAGIWHDEELVKELNNFLGENFFLEVQDHNVLAQVNMNKKIIDMSNKYNIPIIHANDSHYIKPEDAAYRDLFLKAKGIYYEEEQNFILDYPDYDTIVKRYEEQGVLTKSQIKEALDNTLVFDKCEPITLINKDIKLPSISKEPNKELKEIINKSWKDKMKNISSKERKSYLDAIRYEFDIIEKTNMADYFILDNKIVELAESKYGGTLTKTGRGCFTGDALVHTLNGIKLLKNVKVGDYVITEDGTFHKVLDTFSYNIKEPMVKISHLYGTDKYYPTVCTRDHKILIYRNRQRQWIEAQNIIKGDYVCVPKVKFEDKHLKVIDLNDYNDFNYKFDDNFIYEEYERSNKRYNKAINRYIKVDVTFNKFIGLMYGDGFNNSTKNCEIGLAINTQTDKNIINKEIFYDIANRLGLSVYENINEERHLNQLYIHSKVFTNFIKKELFQSQKGRDKEFNPKWFNQSREMINGVIFGLRNSDGSKATEKDHRINFDNTSLSIINAYKLMCLYTNDGVNSLSIRPSWKDKRGYKCKESYKLRINPNARTTKKILEDDNYFYLPIKKIEFIEQNFFKVYDLKVEGKHSYLINNMVVHNSAPSFYSTNLLGLTDIDRLQSPITLFPTRFMSVERILGAKSLPDIDLNTANAEPFIQASKDLLGAENCAWMITWKPLQESSAFRLYCKAIGKDINDYNDIAKEIDKYKDDPYWAPIIKDSEPFIGVIESMAPSPCSMCLYDKPIKEEIGLIKVKDQMVCLLDGYNCDKYKYLKNDYLTVMVWGIIKDVCDLAGIPIPTIEELNNLLDDKTYDIYAKGLTCSINQADSDYATNLVKRYKPTSPAEMSAFVAIIRPGCASLLDDFIERKPYTTGVEQLDELLEDSGHRMIYQESIMKYLIWLGIDEPGSYDIIKKIAKKKFKEQELAELKEKLIKGWTNKVGKEDGFQETWQVVQDAAKYSFNASHSLSYAYDSLYGAYLKSHYPLEYYTVAFNYYLGDEDRTKKLTDEIKYFNISLNKPKFRYSKDKYFYDKETNSIYKGTSSIKYLSDNASLFLYSLKDKQFDTFTDFLVEASNSSDIDSRQLEILIKLQYFEEFGKNQKLLNIYDKFKKLYGRKTVNKEKMAELELTPEMLKDNYEKETEKQFSGVNMYNIIKAYEKECLDLSIPLNEQISYENEILGYINATYDISKKYCYVLKAETKYSPKLTLYCLCNGKEVICKVNRATFEKEPLMKGDVIECLRFKEKNKTIKTEKGFQETSEKEWWLQLYSRVNNKELNELLGG